MKELTKEEVLNLETGTEYVIYNPLCNTYKIERANIQDIVHNKHCYDKLRFFIIDKEDKNDN